MFGKNKENLEEIAEACFLSGFESGDTTFNWQTPVPSNQQMQQQNQTPSEEGVNNVVNNSINSLKSKLDILLKELDNSPDTPQLEFLKVLITNDIDAFVGTLENKMALVSNAINIAQNANISGDNTITNQVNLQEPMIISMPLNQF